MGNSGAGAGAFESASLRIMNMDCPMEERLIRKKLASMPGIKDLDFNLMSRVLKVKYEPGGLPDIIAALKAIDMAPEELGEDDGARKAIPETKLPWKRLAIAGLIALASEICGLLGEWTSLGAIMALGFPLMEACALILALAAIALSGLVTFKKGWIAVSTLNLNINALMSVAVTGALLIGQFPEAAMVMVLFNVSEALEAMALDKARNNIKKLMDLAPDMVTVLTDHGHWHEMPAAKARPGDICRVRPGEKIGLDGVVTSGNSEVNQAPITGESVPVSKGPGDRVFSGTINESGSFEFRVTAAAKDSSLSRIISAVEEAQAKRAPMQRFVDVFAKFYTPCVFILALLWAFVPPLVFGADWRESIYTSLTLLVIGCPCALVISTPVTIVSGLAAAARKGVIIKGGLYLEQGRRLNWIALDKTGTITIGRPELKGEVILDKAGGIDFMAIAASLADRSDHPISRAIARAGHEKGLRPLPVDNFTAIPGQGVSGEIQGALWRLGNMKLLKALGKDSAELAEKIESLEAKGNTVVALIGEKGAAALFAAADQIRKTSVQAIKELRALNVKTMMLTGDNEYTARAMAEESGVNSFRANLLPEGKLEAIESLEKDGNVVGMAGDGINDAPALAKADISFSMAKGGSDIAIEAADVALMDDNPLKIPAFIRLSRKTRALLVENISLALIIKAVFFALTLTGNATMWMAVFADVGAALLVTANGLRNMRCD